jgi:hypothetical protein
MVCKGATMNPFDSLWGTIVAGVILTAVLAVAVRSFLN